MGVEMDEIRARRKGRGRDASPPPFIYTLTIHSLTHIPESTAQHSTAQQRKMKTKKSPIGTDGDGNQSNPLSPLSSACTPSSLPKRQTPRQLLYTYLKTRAITTQTVAIATTPHQPTKLSPCNNSPLRLRKRGGGIVQSTEYKAHTHTHMIPALSATLEVPTTGKYLKVIGDRIQRW